jgi:circadian clock protein KaiC
MHLAVMLKRVQEHRPAAVVVDLISNFASNSEEKDVHLMLIRLVDFFKSHGITSLFTNLTSGDMPKEATDMGISSVMDTWLLVRDIEIAGERNRGLYVLKSRGMKHSNQIREFLITPEGVDLLDVYTGGQGVLTGSARLSQEARERAEKILRDQDTQRKQAELERKRAALDAQIAAMEASFEAEKERALREISIDQIREQSLLDDRAKIAQSRYDDRAMGQNAAVYTGNGCRGGKRRSKRP